MGGEGYCGLGSQRSSAKYEAAQRGASVLWAALVGGTYMHMCMHMYTLIYRLRHKARQRCYRLALLVAAVVRHELHRRRTAVLVHELGEAPLACNRMQERL